MNQHLLQRLECKTMNQHLLLRLECKVSNQLRGIVVVVIVW